VVRPTPTGVETFTTVKSGDAAEDYTWEVDLVGNQELRETPDGGVQVIDLSSEPGAETPGPRPPDVPGTAAELEALKASGEAAPNTEMPDPTANLEARQAALDAGAAAAPPTDPQNGPTPDAEPVLTQDLSAAGVPPADPPPDTAEAADATLAQALADAGDDAQATASAELAENQAFVADVNERPHVSDLAAHEPVVVAEIHPPTSVDASGQDVPTTLSVAGDTVTLHVDHADAGYAYPIVADPWITVVKYRLTWHCCVPTYRTETRVRWESRLTYIGDWWSAAIFQAPNRVYWGNRVWTFWNWYWGWVLMGDWGWSPMYAWVQTPVYYTVQVFTGWRAWQQWDAYTELEWRDDWDDMCRQAFGSDVEGYRAFCLQQDGDGLGPDFDDTFDSFDAEGTGPDSLSDALQEQATDSYSDTTDSLPPSDVVGLMKSAPVHAAESGPDIPDRVREVCFYIPFSCRDYARDASKAAQLTGRIWRGRYKNSSETKANAFQHVFWVALMVNSKPDRHENAAGLAVAYENEEYKRPRNDFHRRSSRMDMINDSWGYRIGKQHAAERNDEFFCSVARDLVRLTDGYMGPFADPYRWVRNHGGNRGPVWRYKYDKTRRVKVVFNGRDCSPA
jgi:hypothetical protein